MKTIVHVSGYSLAEKSDVEAFTAAGVPLRVQYNDWEYVCWGSFATQRLGRIPMALWLARTIRADALVWSTGATFGTDGKVSEAEYLYSYALSHYHRLCSEFPHRFTKKTWVSERAYQGWLKGMSVFDASSTDTLSSMDSLHRVAKGIVRANEHAMVYLVTSANHAPRVLRDAEVVFGIGTCMLEGAARFTLCAVPAESNYGADRVYSVQVKDLSR